MRKYLNTLVAIVILGALWGSFYFYGKRKAKAAPKTETKEEKILPIAQNQIQSITLKPRDGEPVTCARGGGNQWAITEPEELPADQDAVNSLLSTLTSATVDEVASPNASDLKDFGLDAPAEAIQIATNSKPAELTLLLGEDTPTSSGIYAQVSGNPRVVTLASYLKTSLEKNLFDLRDKRAVTLNLDQLNQIEVKSKSTSYTLGKNPEGVWDLVLPPPVRADHFTVDSLVDQLRGLSMQSVVSEKKVDTAKYGLAPPQLAVKLSDPAGTQTLEFGQKEKTGGDDYAVNSALAPIFTLDSSVISQLEKQPGDLRDKDLFSFSQFDARRLDLTTPAGHRVFVLQGKDWKQTVPSAKNISRGNMDDLLSDLRDLRADSFPKDVSIAAAGLTEPAYRFEVQYGAKNQSEVVEASKVKNHLYARRSTDPLPCELSAGSLGAIEKALAKM